MVTRLHGALKREVSIKGRAYVVLLDERGIKLTVKGRRNGQQVRWDDFVNGDAALAVALNASLAQANDDPPVATRRPAAVAAKVIGKAVKKKGMPARPRATRKATR